MNEERRVFPSIKDAAESLLIPLAFSIPILILYFLDSNSFQTVWKGRTPYLIFLWLLFLELTLNWKKISKNRFQSLGYKRTAVFAVTLAIPTVYVIATHWLGLNAKIVELGQILGASSFGEWFLYESWPQSVECILFFSLFTASILLLYGVVGVKRTSISLLFLGATGFFYMLDTFYPYGTFSLFQSFVPITTSFSAQILKWMGYGIQMQTIPSSYSEAYQGGILLSVSGGTQRFSAIVYWPCAGIQSLVMYTLVILLFIRYIPIPPQSKINLSTISQKIKSPLENAWASKLSEFKIIRAATAISQSFFNKLLRMLPIFAIFLIGATGTFIVNALRIVSIYRIGVAYGQEAANLFHTYYGELYFIAWIITYLTLLVLGPRVWSRLSSYIFNRKLTKSSNSQKTILQSNK